jgi:drug/metabolite transporter (DMT)-like permease
MKPWILYAFIALIGTGTGNFLMKVAAQTGLSPYTALVLLFFAEFLMSLVLWSFKRPELYFPLPGWHWIMLAGIAFAIGLFSLMNSFTQPGSQTGVATAILNTNFVWVALLCFFFLGETLSIKQMLGFASVMIGITLLI